MGCVASKQAVSVTPVLEYSVAVRDNAAGGLSSSARCRDGSTTECEKKCRNEMGMSGSELDESGRANSICESRLRNLPKYVEGEQVAAGWPAWLSAVAGEAIHGWVPLRADAYEKLEKIGQGTYSTVFRARDLDTGKIVAMKKVRFDNYEPESVRFMAREIMILRRLDHPNIIKLEGLVTSRLSSSIYLVFEYMEHDITGLLSCPDINFNESQIKCYMEQLLSGLEHCHSRGVMHRDIKGSNLLVNNEGILKVADFGLANFCSSGNRQPLTSRVVTLWYRPPELLLGSTDYAATVDLWSVGCVFAELIVGEPILQGRTEVEQLHKIFKLCGSPPEEYWNKSKLPHATLFKPQQPYDSCLRDTFKDLPITTVNLIKTLLSVEPYKRGTASSALASEYFKTEPIACDPSSLPVYPPSKEIDAKNRDDAKRKKNGSRTRGPETRKPMRRNHGINKLAPIEGVTDQGETRDKISGNNGHSMKRSDVVIRRVGRKPSIDILQEALHVKNASQGDIPFSGPLQVSTSSGFAWAKRRDDESLRSHSRSISKLDPSAVLHVKNPYDSQRHDKGDILYGCRTGSRGRDRYEIVKREMQKDWSQFDHPDSFDASEYHSQELSRTLYQREQSISKRNNMGYQDQEDKVEFSGPLLCQSHRVDELLERNERHIRKAVRKSWFHRVRKQGNTNVLNSSNSKR